MDASGQSQAHGGPSEAPGSHTQHVRCLPGIAALPPGSFTLQQGTTSAAGVAGTGEEPVQELGVPSVDPPPVAVPTSANSRFVTFGDVRQLLDLFEEQQTQRVGGLHDVLSQTD